MAYLIEFLLTQFFANVIMQITQDYIFTTTFFWPSDLVLILHLRL